jgi:hypothetical protein
LRLGGRRRWCPEKNKNVEKIEGINVPLSASSVLGRGGIILFIKKEKIVKKAGFCFYPIECPLQGLT